MKTQEQLQDLHVGLTKRMDRMEASQEEKERSNGLEFSVFCSLIGRGNPMSREALDVTPPRRVSPGVSLTRVLACTSVDTLMRLPTWKWLTLRSQRYLIIIDRHQFTYRSHNSSLYPGLSWNLC